MQQEESLVIILIVVLLFICYFSPLTNSQGKVDYFGNQRSGKNESTGVSGSYVQQVELTNKSASGSENNQLFPGPPESFNVGPLANFPFLEQSKTSDNDTKISLIKKDGVVLGGYRPQITRPFDSVSATSTDPNCTWPCYSNKKFQTWCNENNAMMYHGMRPIIEPNEYNALLKKMFSKIRDSIPSSVNVNIATSTDDNLYSPSFCSNTQGSLMKFIMQKIALAVQNMPEMQKNGPWVSERFYDTDVQLFEFKSKLVSEIMYRIVFNLYNPLRSVSTLVVATVFVYKDKMYLYDIDFVSNGTMGDYQAPMNGFGPINGKNLLRNTQKSQSIVEPTLLGYENSPQGQMQADYNYLKDPNEFDWLYMNTLESQKFNKYGYYSNVPGENIIIKGGVPESLKKGLAMCKEENLMSCNTPGFTGVVDGSFKKLGSGISNVALGPTPIYTINDNDIKNVQMNVVSDYYV